VIPNNPNTPDLFACEAERGCFCLFLQVLEGGVGGTELQAVLQEVPPQKKFSSPE
jgi:hypothetical protein